MKIKFSITLFALCVAGVLTLFAFQKKYQESLFESKAQANSRSKLIASQQTADNKFASNDTNLLQADTTIDVKNLFYWVTTDGQNEFHNFLQSRGHGLTAENSDFNSYDLNTLEKLAESSNDLKVLHALAHRYMTSGLRDKATETYEAAALHGSSNALIQIGEYYSADYAVNRELSIEEKRKLAQLTLGYHQAALLRGDYYAVPSAKTFIDVHGIVLNENDQARVAEIAKQIYDELQAKRIELGLGKFNDTVPDGVKGFYSTLTQQNNVD